MRTDNFLVRWIYRGLTTTCEIKNRDGEIISTASMTKYYTDPPWKKEFLRKEVMKKAVSQIQEKRLRAEIWEGYRTMKTKPRW